MFSNWSYQRSYSKSGKCTIFLSLSQQHLSTNQTKSHINPLLILCSNKMLCLLWSSKANQAKYRHKHSLLSLTILLVILSLRRWMSICCLNIMLSKRNIWKNTLKLCKWMCWIKTYLLPITVVWIFCPVFENLFLIILVFTYQ